jgi:hypothetical protein
LCGISTETAAAALGYMVVAAAAAPVGYMADVATTAAAECVRGKCYWVRERKLMVL